MTSADIFAGGGGWSLGAKAAGFTPIWAVEHDPAIAEVYAANIGAHVIVDEAQNVDIYRLEKPDILLCSPPCQQDSNARSKSLPRRDDAEAGRCVKDYLRILKPRFFMLENVEGYKRNKVFLEIFDYLHELGYWTNVQVLNAADFGVPQTRRRLILRASREGFLPPLPPPTPWRGWYEAIEDLIPTLPESKFAEWQLKRRPELLQTTLIGQQFNKPQECEDRQPQQAASDQPAMNVTASLGGKGKMPCAFIVRASDQRENCDIARDGGEPVFTLTEGNTAHGRVKAFVVDGKQNDNGASVTVRHGDAPIFGLVAQHGGRQPLRAFIVDGGNTNRDKVDSVARDGRQPSFTIAENASRNTRAWLEQGRVVAMTPRALARFQSIPDGYLLPDKTGLACRIIGNFVPPLMAEALTGGLA